MTPPAHPLVHVAQRLAGRLARAQAAAEAGRDGVGQHHLGDALPVPRGGHLPGDSQQRLALHHCTGPLTAPAVLSAYPPAPTSGLSPTRPGSLPVIPPVEVAQARLPAWSQHNSDF